MDWPSISPNSRQLRYTRPDKAPAEDLDTAGKPEIDQRRSWRKPAAQTSKPGHEPQQRARYRNTQRRLPSEKSPHNPPNDCRLHPISGRLCVTLLDRHEACSNQRADDEAGQAAEELDGPRIERRVPIPAAGQRNRMQQCWHLSTGIHDDIGPHNRGEPSDGGGNCQQADRQYMAVVADDRCCQQETEQEIMKQQDAEKIPALKPIDPLITNKRSGRPQRQIRPPGHKDDPGQGSEQEAARQFQQHITW